MAGASDALRLVRQQADGSLEWNGYPLVTPDQDGDTAVLAQLDTEAVVGASSFVITPSGEWLATVAGVQYNVFPAIVVETGNFAFIGVPTGQ